MGGADIELVGSPLSKDIESGRYQARMLGWRGTTLSKGRSVVGDGLARKAYEFRRGGRLCDLG